MIRGFYEREKARHMEQSYVLDDTLLPHPIRRDFVAHDIRDSRVLGFLCFDPPLPSAPFYNDEKNGLQGFSWEVLSS